MTTLLPPSHHLALTRSDWLLWLYWLTCNFVSAAFRCTTWPSTSPPYSWLALHTCCMQSIGVEFICWMDRFCQVDVLKWLIKQGTSVVEQNLYKKTALDLAKRHNHQACVQLLKDLTSTELLLRKSEQQIRYLEVGVASCSSD